MMDALLWISRNQNGIYLALAALGSGLLWYWWRAQSHLRFATFSLEREALVQARGLAAALMFVVLTLMAALFLINTFITPNIPETFRATRTPATLGETRTPGPTPTPLLVLPGLETPTLVSIEPTPSRTPVPVGGSNCLNPQATINSPIPGAILYGEVEVRGTANIDNFAFYVVEISTLGENWLTVITSQPEADGTMRPVVNGVLGVWNTALQTPGDYALRLVVYNSVGNFPEPCTIPITIVSPPTATPTP